MKKLLIFLFLILCIFLTSCGNPNGLSDIQYKACLKSVETIDKYLEFEISQESAKKQIDEIKSRIDNIETDSSTYLTMESVSISLSCISYELVSQNPDENEIIKNRNDIAKEINIPEK